MQDGATSINDLVTQAAAANKAEADKANADAGGEKKENDKGDGDGEKAKAGEDAALTEDQKKAAAEAEKKPDDAAEKAKEDAEKAKPDAEKDKPDPIAELLKEHKFTDLDELKEFLAKKNSKAKSEDDLKREADVYKANLNKFAVEKGVMSNDDIVKYENQKGRPDKDLVFEKFSGEVKNEIVDDLKEELDREPTSAEIEEKIKESFEKEFPLESKNKSAKGRAEKKLAKEAKEIRSPFESSYTRAKESFDSERQIAEAYPGYEKKLNSIISKNITKELAVYSEKDGDKDIAASIELTDDEQKAVAEKAFKKASTPEMFKLYQEKKFDKITEILREETDTIIWKEYRSRGLQKVASTFQKLGFDKGQVGAKESFAMKEEKGATEKKDALTAQQQVLESTTAKKV
jgi:hypothetical protein